MSDDTEIKDSNYWLENAIFEKLIKSYDYSDFKNIQLIGTGSSGKVFQANWKYSNQFVALKSFNEGQVTLKEFVKEV